MCSDLGPLAAVFGQDSICQHINVSWVHYKYHHTDAVLEFTEVQGGRAADVYRANTMK